MKLGDKSALREVKNVRNFVVGDEKRDVSKIESGRKEFPVQWWNA